MAMPNLFLTENTNYWNKSSSQLPITLQSYFSLPRKNDSYLPFSPRCHLTACSELQTAVTCRVNSMGLTQSHRALLAEQIYFTTFQSKNGNTLVLTVDELLSQFISWRGKEFNTYKVRGELIGRIVKPFIRTLERLKANEKDRFLKIKSRKMRDISRSICDVFQQIASRETLISQISQIDSLDSLQRHTPEPEGRVLQEVERLMQRFDTQQEMEDQNQQILLYKEEQRIRQMASKKNIKIDQEHGTQNKKVKFEDKDLVDDDPEDDEQSLRRELQLLIKKTEEILKPSEESS